MSRSPPIPARSGCCTRGTRVRRPPAFTPCRCLDHCSVLRSFFDSPRFCGPSSRTLRTSCLSTALTYSAPTCQRHIAKISASRNWISVPKALLPTCHAQVCTPSSNIVNPNAMSSSASPLSQMMKWEWLSWQRALASTNSLHPSPSPAAQSWRAANGMFPSVSGGAPSAGFAAAASTCKTQPGQMLTGTSSGWNGTFVTAEKSGSSTAGLAV